MIKSTEVYILGQKYIIKGEASPQYMNELAKFVDASIREILKNSPSTPPLKAAILASINMADELFKLKKKEKYLLDYVNEKTAALELIFSEEQ